MKIVSACLLGINCKYNGKNNANKKILKLTEKETLIPVCPEQLGGLPTPRIPAEIRDGRAINREGDDVTEYLEKGAREVLGIARIYGIEEAILKQRSPSCGCGQIYDGSFSSTVIKGNGITAGLLKENGIKVISEEDL